MLTPEQIAQSVTASRTEFGTLFLQAQVGTFPAQRVAFEAVTNAPEDKEAFLQALQWAQGQGWLNELVDSIIHEGLEDGRLAQWAATEAARQNPDAELQAITNELRNFGQPHLYFRGYANGLKWTGKIVVDGNATGTGILIGPHLVLTAWHTVRSLFAQEGEDWRALPDSGDRLEVVFDDFMAIVSRGAAFKPVKSFRVPAQRREWCVIFSQCHEEELANRLPHEVEQLDGHWDYVVIRLSKAVGMERRWATLDAKAVVPKAQEEVIIFQHPVGQTLRIGHDVIGAAVPPYQRAVPSLRFLHCVNTLPGSSGGPCFDRSFMLFGLHQGVWERIGANGVLNRGIPITRIAAHVKSKIERLPLPRPQEITLWKLEGKNSNIPVIGCDAFQSLIWTAAMSGMPKLVSIKGGLRSGKTFCIELLSTLLHSDNHLKIILSAEAVGRMGAPELAAHISKVAGMVHPSVISAEEMNTTEAAWLKDELLPRFMEALDKQRSGRLVWFCLTDLNHFEIEGTNTSPFLFLLYEQVLRFEWLRVVLDGMRGDIPDSLAEVHEVYRTAAITPQDLEYFLKRASAALELPLDDVSIKAEAIDLVDRYTDLLDNEPEEALRQLAKTAMRKVGIYTKVADQLP